MNLSFKTILGMALLFITVQATAQQKEEKIKRKSQRLLAFSFYILLLFPKSFLIKDN
mgnify:CR=1 FL=1